MVSVELLTILSTVGQIQNILNKLFSKVISNQWQEGNK